MRPSQIGFPAEYLVNLKSLEEKDKNLKVGEYLIEELPPLDFGRIAVQTAKQVNKAFNETPSVDLSRMKPNEKRELAAAYLKRQESENKIKDLKSVFADEINK